MKQNETIQKTPSESGHSILDSFRSHHDRSTMIFQNATILSFVLLIFPAIFFFPSFGTVCCAPFSLLSQIFLKRINRYSTWTLHWLCPTTSLNWNVNRIAVEKHTLCVRALFLSSCFLSLERSPQNNATQIFIDVVAHTVSMEFIRKTKRRKRMRPELSDRNTNN